ncbi:MAG: MBL fold metallo-hydrolase [Methanobacteriaceae archaeon]|nr:MBL fold metallo-hydrolase [Methanobacteriaceae archaeon]
MSVSIKCLSKYSWFKIKANNKVIHIDPGYAGYLENQEIPKSELKERADIVLVTHHHMDHLQEEALSQIQKSDTTILAPEKCQDRIGGNFQKVKPGDELKIDGINVKVVNAYNTPEGNSTRKLHHKGDGVGYIFTFNSFTFYHAGDTDFIPEMNDFPQVDVALLPMGGVFTMDVDEAIKAALTINPQTIIPMHQKDADPEQFKKKIEQNQDKSESNMNVVILGMGESFQLE